MVPGAASAAPLDLQRIDPTVEGFRDTCASDMCLDERPSLSTESTTDVRLPASGDIRQELVNIRKTYGLTHRAIKLHGIKLQSLPAVADELERLGAHTDDLPVAAKKAVSCAVDNYIADFRERAVLEHTLNIRRGVPLYGDLPPMSQRLQNCANELCFAHDGKSSAMDKLLGNSYRELAAVLVGAERSPCRRSRPSRREQWAAFEASTFTGAEFLALFALLADPQSRQRIAREAERLYPKGFATAFRRLGARSELEAFILLLQATIAKDYVPENTPEGPLLLRANLRRILFPKGSARKKVQTRSADDAASFYAVRRTSLDRLADLLAAGEQNSWRGLRRPPTASRERTKAKTRIRGTGTPTPRQDGRFGRPNGPRS